MRKIVTAVMALALMGWLGATPARAAEKAKPPSCDRACLEGLVGKYLSALPTHDPSKLPLARTARFVENDQPLKFGQGTWVSVTGLGVYRHVFSDPQAGEAAVITTVKENGKGAILDLVLKVQDRRIADVESQIIRDASGAELYDKMGAPAPEWLQAVPAADRVPREALVAAANRYLTGMVRDDPKGDYSFFDPDCDRIEHARHTTNLKTPEAYGHSSDFDFSSMGCEAQFKTGFLGFVTAIRDRRFVVDEERQALFAFADLDHNGTVRVLHLSTGKDFVIPGYFDVPRTLQAGEAYKERAGKLWRIEMTLTELPYGMHPAGVAPPPPAPAPPPRPAKNQPPPACDRDCLQDLLVRTLQAMVDHRPGDAPLAQGVRYTENGQQLAPGDGIWGTATAIAMPGDGLSSLGRNLAAYKLFLADPSTGQAACLCATNENGTPGMMAIRIKAAGGKLSEIEAVIVRQEVGGPRGGTMTLMRTPVLAEFTPDGFKSPDPALTRPPPMRTTRPGMIIDANRYFDAIAYDLHAPQPAAIEGATRLNGHALTGVVPGSAVRDRRVWLIDEETGLELASAVLDHDGSTPPPLPYSNLFAGVLKIEGGRIAAVEGLERPVPYGMTSGWAP